MYVNHIGEDNVEDDFYKKFKVITQDAFVAYSKQLEQSSSSQGTHGWFCHHCWLVCLLACLFASMLPCLLACLLVCFNACLFACLLAGWLA